KLACIQRFAGRSRYTPPRSPEVRIGWNWFGEWDGTDNRPNDYGSGPGCFRASARPNLRPGHVGPAARDDLPAHVARTQALAVGHGGRRLVGSPAAPDARSHLRISPFWFDPPSAHGGELRPRGESFRPGVGRHHGRHVAFAEPFHPSVERPLRRVS